LERIKITWLKVAVNMYLEFLNDSLPLASRPHVGSYFQKSTVSGVLSSKAVQVIQKEALNKKRRGSRRVSGPRGLERPPIGREFGSRYIRMSVDE
jgi:hypothetical protein